MKKLCFCFVFISLTVAEIIVPDCKMKAQETLSEVRLFVPASPETPTQPLMTVTSPDFKQDSAIPKRFTCQGESISPALAWSGAPSSTKSFALICEDPDAPRGMFVHWVIYNIPTTETGLARNIPTTAELPSGAMQGMNGANKIGFIGPCPPVGKAHRYYFRLFALDRMLSLAGNIDSDALMGAMKGRIVSEGQLMATYQRQ